jgi:TrmH family RNA methyltransferase
MVDLRVVLVEPRHEGNVGAVARLLRNFGVEDFVLVRPPPLGEGAFRRAMFGADLLRRARHVETVADAVADVDWIAGTTGVATATEKRFLRLAIPPGELAKRMADVDGRVALLFGREDFGLRNEELEACDVLVTIPADPAYAILNLSHAVAILLYELRRAPPAKRPRAASGAEKEVLYRTFDDLLDAIAYPAHKRDRTRVMFRRLMGRAMPSKWEFHALMGVLGRAVKALRRLERER